MRKSKYSEHQIIAILKAVEAGKKVADACREHELSDRPTTNGRQSTAGWKQLTSGGCVNWKTRTGG